MHGRLKVRTTKEENARKQAERELKVKAYRGAMDKIMKKRAQNEFDDDLMQLVTPLLQRNPDISTLWNIRRQCLTHKFQELDQNKIEIEKLCDAELKFTEVCLVANPKSYCGWHQRCWILQQNPQPNWQQELDLCTKYLKLDERNFHTWDYRRFVIEKGKFAADSEFQYCTEKIKINFSNYSSWHHRSLLLPVLFPNTNENNSENKCPFQEDVLKKELDMVLTAAFTDPNDSSAWFYQRWLLGPQKVDSYVCAFRKEQEKAVLVFSKPLTNSALPKIIDAYGNEIIMSRTIAENGTVWMKNLPASFEFPNENDNYYLIVNTNEHKTIKLQLESYDNGYYYFLPPQDNLMVSHNNFKDELRNQLKSCEDLLEYEPESKWTLLTTVCLMRAIDRRGYFRKMQEHLNTLMLVDYLREGYYKDLAVQWNFEEIICKWIESKEFPKTVDLTHLKDLDRIPHKQYMRLADEIIFPKNFNQTSAFLTFKDF